MKNGLNKKKGYDGTQNMPAEVLKNAESNKNAKVSAKNS